MQTSSSSVQAIGAGDGGPAGLFGGTDRQQRIYNPWTAQAYLFDGTDVALVQGCLLCVFVVTLDRSSMESDS